MSRVATPSLRRLCGSTPAWLALLLLAPLWLGPMAAPLMRIFGAFEHVCACGMAPGKCGCPECARLEAEQRTDAASGPALRAPCGRDGFGVPGSTPPACPLPERVAVLDAAPLALLPRPGHGQPKALLGKGPPTPPPRSTLL